MLGRAYRRDISWYWPAANNNEIVCQKIVKKTLFGGERAGRVMIAKGEKARDLGKSRAVSKRAGRQLVRLSYAPKSR